MKMLVPEVQEFAAAIRENRQPVITAADGRKVLKILDAVRSWMPWWNQVARVDLSGLASQGARVLSPVSGASLHPRQFVAPPVAQRQAETVHHVQPPAAHWAKNMDEDVGIRLHQWLHDELVTVDFDWA